jgi:hypothetical protein
VSDSLVPRTLQTFKILDLIGDDGRHTELLENFRRAPQADYQPMMAEWLKAAYEHALDVIDPATADETAIRDAFRHYNPISMQPRMITLFTSLFEAAGVRDAERPRPPPRKVNSGAGTSSSRVVVRPTSRNTIARPPAERQPPPPPPAINGLHPALAGLLSSLPSAERGWTKADRDRFMEAFGVVLDFAHPPGVVQIQTNTAEADDADA